MTQTFPTPRKPLDPNRVKHCKKPSSDATAEERRLCAKARKQRKAKRRASFVPDERSITLARYDLARHNPSPWAGKRRSQAGEVA